MNYMRNYYARYQHEKIMLSLKYNPFNIDLITKTNQPIETLHILFHINVSK